jgi:hypothetical protein
MIRVTIYQAPFDETYRGFDQTAGYTAVWVEPWDEAPTTDEIWTRFQRVDEVTGPWPPDGYKGRSLSIGDVVAIGPDFFTPESVGWRQLDSAEVEFVKDAAAYRHVEPTEHDPACRRRQDPASVHNGLDRARCERCRNLWDRLIEIGARTGRRVTIAEIR